MINAQQTLYSKNEDKSIKHFLLLPAVYFTQGQKDEQTKFESKVKDEKLGVTKSLTYDVPKDENKSAHTDDELLASMINDFYRVEFNGEANTEKSPIRMLLQHAQTGANQYLKNKNKPVEELDENAALDKLIKFYVKMGLPESVAKEQAKASLASVAAVKVQSTEQKAP